jgi:hypothetical protein
MTEIIGFQSWHMKVKVQAVSGRALLSEMSPIGTLSGIRDWQMDNEKREKITERGTDKINKQNGKWMY